MKLASCLIAWFSFFLFYLLVRLDRAPKHQRYWIAKEQRTSWKRSGSRAKQSSMHSFAHSFWSCWASLPVSLSTIVQTYSSLLINSFSKEFGSLLEISKVSFGQLYAQTSPHVSGIRNPAIFLVWNPESSGFESRIQEDRVVGIRNPETRNPESRKIKLLKYGIQGVGIRNPKPQWIMLHGTTNRASCVS